MKGRRERGAGLGEGARLRGEEERGRVGLKRKMEMRERGLDGQEMETEEGGRDGKASERYYEGEIRKTKRKKVIHKHFQKKKDSTFFTGS